MASRRRCLYCLDDVPAVSRAHGTAGCVRVDGGSMRLAAVTVYVCGRDDHHDRALKEVSIHAEHSIEMIQPSDDKPAPAKRPRRGAPGEGQTALF